MGIKIHANNWLEGANERCNGVHVLRVALLFHIGAVCNATVCACVCMRGNNPKLIFIIIAHSLNSFSSFASLSIVYSAVVTEFNLSELNQL